MGRIITVVSLLCYASCGNSAAAQGSQSGGHLTIDNTVRDIVNHPAFSDFGERLLTRDDNSSYYNTRISNARATAFTSFLQ